jgi:hypothetical protein
LKKGCGNYFILLKICGLKCEGHALGVTFLSGAIVNQALRKP